MGILAAEEDGSSNALLRRVEFCWTNFPCNLMMKSQAETLYGFRDEFLKFAQLLVGWITKNCQFVQIWHGFSPYKRFWTNMPLVVCPGRHTANCPMLENSIRR